MRKVLIYCCTGNAEHVTYLLNEEDYEVIGYSDSNPESWGKHLYGGVVYPPSEIPKLDFDLVVISISTYAEEIKNDLINNYGVKDEQITVFQPIDKGIELEDERIAMLRKCVMMLKERHIPGSMAEVGVYTGEFSKLFNRYFPKKKLYLFDTFEGFDSKRDQVNDCDLDNFKDTSIEVVLNKMVTPDNCIIRKGYFPYTAEGIEDTFCLVSLDADLYNPILAGLEYFYPRMEKGGYIFIHDFGSYHYEGVKDAVYKYCNEHGAAMVPIMDRCLSVIVAK